MGRQLRLIVVEDSEDDTLLLLRELRKGDYDVEYERVETPESMKAALVGQWDLVIADYVLPTFSGLEALKLVQEKGVDLPFIIVSGNIGEDTAVAAMKAGAHDYILKSNMKRLIPAVERELREAEMRRQRKSAQVALETERHRLNDVLDMLPAYVLLLAADNSVPFANRLSRERFGKPDDKRCFEYMLGRTEPCHPCTCKVFETPAPRPREWTDLKGRNYEVFGYPFTGADGSPLTLEVGIDVTDRKQAEEQLRHAQKMEALGTLTGGVAHDFNNILAAIIGFTEMVRDRLRPESRDAHSLDRVMEAALRGRDLIKQMLAFSRKTEQKRKPVQLSSTVKETMRLLQGSVPTTISINFKVNSESGLIFGDPVQLEQVLLNLCTNAVYAMREKGGTIDIELSDFEVPHEKSNGMNSGPYAKLTVRDTGTGIPAENIDKVFDPFFTTKRPDEGTGLGLSVVHGIIHQHDGYISVESQHSKGSLFTVYLPRISQHLSSTGTTTSEVIPNGHRERILFIDDEEPLAEMAEGLLRQLGYQVTVRTSSKEALALFRLDPSQFDLVLTDQTMPYMTGMELAREVIALRPGIPVILSTGFSHLVDADSARQAGIKAFAMKPLTKREIARTVRKVLDE